MIDWSKISDTSKYVVDGDNAKWVYDVLQMSYVGKNKTLPTSLSRGTSNYNYKLEYKYEDGVLYIEESVSGGPGGFIDEILLFLVPHDSIYALVERCKDGVPWSYSIKDDEGKYVTDENGEEVLVTIDDDDEFDRIADMFEDEFMTIEYPADEK